MKDSKFESSLGIRLARKAHPQNALNLPYFLAKGEPHSVITTSDRVISIAKLEYKSYPQTIDSVPAGHAHELMK